MATYHFAMQKHFETHFLRLVQKQLIVYAYLDAKQVKIIALLIARGLSGWLKVQDKYPAVFTSLSFATNNLIKELEQWKV